MKNTQAIEGKGNRWLVRDINMVYIGLVDSYVEPIIQALKQNKTDLPAEIIDALGISCFISQINQSDSKQMLDQPV